jgi:hypothetical protein
MEQDVTSMLVRRIASAALARSIVEAALSQLRTVLSDNQIVSAVPSGLKMRFQVESCDEKRLKSQHGFEWNLAPQGIDEWRLVEVVLRRRGLNVEASVVDPGWITT